MLPTLQQAQQQAQPTRLLLDVESGTTVAVFNVVGVANAADAIIYKGRSEFSLVKMAGATTGQIAVLFPDIGEPYRSVFTKIIEGIEEKAKGRVLSVPVGNNVNPSELATELRKQDVKVVVGLGRQGQSLVALPQHAVLEVGHERPETQGATGFARVRFGRRSHEFVELSSTVRDFRSRGAHLQTS